MPAENAHGDYGVSIRAPQSLAGRPIICAADSGSGTEFQSAPRNRLRGDDGNSSRCLPWHSFNPRPAIACGATRSTERRHRRRQRFNPRPAIACGATASGAGAAPGTQFQSAPRNRLRGDLVEQVWNELGYVSIRAPQSLAGRLRPPQRARPQQLTTAFPPTSQLARCHGLVKLPRNEANTCRCAYFKTTRNSRHRLGACGSRNHRISGSFKSTGFPTPWCSVRCTAASSRK